MNKEAIESLYFVPERVLFTNWKKNQPGSTTTNHSKEFSALKRFVLRHSGRTPLDKNVLILPPSTLRFELYCQLESGQTSQRVVEPTILSMRPNSHLACHIIFIPPARGSADYLWDNFQDRVCVTVVTSAQLEGTSTPSRDISSESKVLCLNGLANSTDEDSKDFSWCSLVDWYPDDQYFLGTTQSQYETRLRELVSAHATNSSDIALAEATDDNNLSLDANSYEEDGISGESVISARDQVYNELHSKDSMVQFETRNTGVRQFSSQNKSQASSTSIIEQKMNDEHIFSKSKTLSSALKQAPPRIQQVIDEGAARHVIANLRLRLNSTNKQAEKKLELEQFDEIVVKANQQSRIDAAKELLDQATCTNQDSRLEEQHAESTKDRCEEDLEPFTVKEVHSVQSHTNESEEGDSENEYYKNLMKKISLAQTPQQLEQVGIRNLNRSKAA